LRQHAKQYVFDYNQNTTGPLNTTKHNHTTNRLDLMYHNTLQLLLINHQVRGYEKSIELIL